MAQMISGRFEEAQASLRDMMADLGENIPPSLQNKFDLQLGWIALVQENYDLAYEMLSKAISTEDAPAYSGDEVMIMTMAALISDRMGKTEEADRKAADGGTQSAASASEWR